MQTHVNARRHPGWVVSLAAVIACAVPVACRTEAPAREGGALAEQNDSSFSPGPLPPGQRFYLLMMEVRNESSEDLVVEKIVPRDTDNLTGTARLTDIELAPRGADIPPISMGPYSLYPLRDRRKGQCITQRTVPVEGQTVVPAVEAEDSMFLLTEWEMVAPGKAFVDGFEVVYLQAGERFRQEIPLRVDLEVVEGAAEPPLYRGERACRDMDLAAAP